MPGVNNVYAEAGSEVQFLMVNLTDGARETVEAAEAYIEERGYDFPIFFDISREAQMMYGVTSIPVTYFIDAEGYIVTWGRGGLSEELFFLGISYIN